MHKMKNFVIKKKLTSIENIFRKKSLKISLRFFTKNIFDRCDFFRYLKTFHIPHSTDVFEKMESKQPKLILGTCEN